MKKSFFIFLLAISISFIACEKGEVSDETINTEETTNIKELDTDTKATKASAFVSLSECNGGSGQGSINFYNSGSGGLILNGTVGNKTLSNVILRRGFGPTNYKFFEYINGNYVGGTVYMSSRRVRITVYQSQRQYTRYCGNW
ncbi:hypothetical protein [Aquimarina megaterium]|uniref:hypothetical protein n=1 Tax=Aquimarina megaterium TaxID=1443666 RepID=UPI000942778F|nr:hypothetical protein [Aquimarina megaterium]